MMPQIVPVEAARAAIAECWLGSAAARGDSAAAVGDERLGRITLRPHQIDAVQQLRAILDDRRGAVLADAVGLGKTYVALAVAREARRPLVVCPAGLRDMWRHAASETNVAISVMTTEAMSRTPRTSQADTDLVVVDEAHHFRNPRTRRYRALARLTAKAPILLMTATPVHNRIGDLIALLSLFLGARAWTLSDAERSRCIVRRDHDLVDLARSLSHGPPGVSSELTLPTIDGPYTLFVGDDVATLEALAALPPPVPPRDGDVCGALATWGLVRQWASSTGALRAALRRRLERAVAIDAALDAGLDPTYRDLRSWCLGDGAIQLALPEVLVPTMPPRDVIPQGRAGLTAARRPNAHADLRDAVRAHTDAVRVLMRQLGAAPDIDQLRAQQLRAIARAHPGAKMVAFSAYEDTVQALYRYLRADARVCALSARGGTVAGGRISRADVVAQFAPAGGRAVPSAERIDVLLTTDLLSEGVNLQGAGIVVHLDLPWTPARLEQRVGRVARLGSTHCCVHVYALAPPAAAETMLRIEQRLRAKLDAAGRAIGIAGSIVPSVTLALANPASQRDDVDAVSVVPNERRATHASPLQAGPTSTGRGDVPWVFNTVGADSLFGVRLAAGDEFSATPSSEGAGRADRASGKAHGPGPPEHLAAARLVVSRWRRFAHDSEAEVRRPMYSAVLAPTPGFLAACEVGHRRLLIGAIDGVASDSPAVIAAAVRLAEGEQTGADTAAYEGAIRAVTEWRCEQRAADDAGLSTIAGAASRLRVLARIAAIARRAPAHLRPGILALSRRARHAATASFGAGAEWVLGQLAGASLSDAAWLRAIGAFGDAYGAHRGHPYAGRADLHIVALIVFRDATLGAVAGVSPERHRT